MALSQDAGAVVLYDTAAGRVVHRFASNRPYERMQIGGATGLNDEQRAALRALGASEEDDVELGSSVVGGS